MISESSYLGIRDVILGDHEHFYDSVIFCKILCVLDLQEHTLDTKCVTGLIP